MKLVAKQFVPIGTNYLRERRVNMSLYRFRQKNVRGYSTLPALNILVEAPSAMEAGDFAMETWGITLNGDECSGCCGSRWTDYGDAEEQSLEEVIKEIRFYAWLGDCAITYTPKGEPIPLFVLRKEGRTVTETLD